MKERGERGEERGGRRGIASRVPAGIRGTGGRGRGGRGAMVPLFVREAAGVGMILSFSALLGIQM